MAEPNGELLRQGTLFGNLDDAQPARRTRRKPARSVESSSAFDEVLETLARIEDRIAAAEVAIAELAQLAAAPAREKEFYTTAEVARILNRRPFTVREWCRLKRVRAVRAATGRGTDPEWRISHAELQRIRNEGLLPQPG